MQTAGIGTVIEGLARSLPQALRASYELVLAGRRPPGPVAENVRVLESPRLVATRLGRLLYEQSVVALAARHVDLVHLGNPRPVLASRTPFLLTVHDLFPLDRPDWYPATFARFKRAMLTRVMDGRPRAVVCDSHYTKERLLTHYPDLDEPTVCVIHPGLADVPVYEPPTVGDGGGHYFLTVATVEPRKNHLGLLQAFRIARACGLRLRRKIVGGEGYH